MSQLTFFNYVTGITIGSIAANMLTNENSNFIGDLIDLIWWALLTIIIGFIALKLPKLRVIIDGEPTIIIKKGKIEKKLMAELRLNMDDLTMLLREKNIFSIKDVEYAILEANGKLSVLKKQEQESVTKKDLNVLTSELKYLPSEVVVDGTIVERNLRELNITKDWLYNELRSLGIKSVSEIFYAELQSDGSLYIDKNN